MHTSPRTSSDIGLIPAKEIIMSYIASMDNQSLFRWWESLDDLLYHEEIDKSYEKVRDQIKNQMLSNGPDPEPDSRILRPWDIKQDDE